MASRGSLVFGVFAAAVACGEVPSVQQSSKRIIYGDDDRTDVYAHPDDALRALARQSIVALVPPVFVLGGEWWPDISTVGDAYGLCDGEPFLDQPTHAFCSGVLVDVDLVLTARHCVPFPEACEHTALVFDYFLDAPDHLAELTEDAVYFCREVIAAGEASLRETDFVFLQLDRPVSEDRAPATWRASRDPLAVGEPVRALGFPMGGPLKIDSGGIVERAPPTMTQYWTTIDGFGGSSGSGVFDADDQLFGLLVAGPDGFKERGDCYALRRVGDAPGQSVVISLNPAIDLLEATGWRARLPDRDGECWSCRTEADCATGHVCVSADAPASSRWCARSCADSLDCAPGQSCTEGRCDGASSLTCLEQEVWSKNSCGRAEAVLEDCLPARWCRSGSCGAPALGRACDSALELPAENFVGAGVIEDDEGRMYGSCGGYGPEVVHRFTLTRRTRVEAVASGLSAVLYLRSVCDDYDTEFACADDNPFGDRRSSRVEVELTPGTYYLVLDSVFSEGAYSISVNFEPVGCGCTAAEGQRRPAGPILLLLAGLALCRTLSGRRPKMKDAPGLRPSDPC